jgi:hypothetical protein
MPSVDTSRTTADEAVALSPTEALEASNREVVQQIRVNLQAQAPQVAIDRYYNMLRKLEDSAAYFAQRGWKFTTSDGRRDRRVNVEYNGHSHELTRIFFFFREGDYAGGTRPTPSEKDLARLIDKEEARLEGARWILEFADRAERPKQDAAVGDPKLDPAAGVLEAMEPRTPKKPAKRKATSH